jgi:NAD(P)-dependent dehydrogenase (short-subunit alcohol dehydrogenase family)
MSKHYLIVGASSGIGAELLRALAARGHAVTHLSRHPENAPDLPGVRGLSWDARDDDFPAAELPEQLDGLVYCPGSIRLRPFDRLKTSEFQDDLELNLLGAVRAIQGALKPLRQSGSASIVLFSTVAVRTGMPYHASVAAAKGAVEGLTRSLAAELAPGIRVNAIAPTITDTPLAERLLSSDDKRAAAAERHPLKRVGEAAEMARTAIWLLEDAPSVTGQIIAVDGGLSSVRLL